MSAPTLTRTGQRMADALSDLQPGDADYDYAYEWFCAARAAMFDTVADIVDRGDGKPGYAILFDPDNCPAAFLPWLGQFVGVQIPAGLDTAAARLRIKETDGFRRGTPNAVEGAARQHLTGTKMVTLYERTDSAYSFLVITYAAETPDSAAVLAALLEQKPAGLVMTYRTDAGWSYGQAEDEHATYGAAQAAYSTYGDAETVIPS